MGSMTTDKLHLIFGDLNLGVAGKGFRYLFSFQRGGLDSMRIDGKEWVYRTPRPTFWRALTDNDRGSQFHLKSGIWLAADMYIRHIATSVKVDGQDIPTPKPPLNNCYTNNEYADSISICFTYETVMQISTTVDVTYTVVPGGAMTVTCKYHGREGLPQFPVFGLRFIMPTTALGFRYEGLSGETYPDRMAGGKHGLYTVIGLPVTPYMVPQDCGMHMETDWMVLERDTVLDNHEQGRTVSSLRISKTDKPFAFSCLPYTAEEIENALHMEELPPARRTVLCIYGAVRGIGGIDSWGADVEEPYHLHADRDVEFSFVLNG